MEPFDQIVRTISLTMGAAWGSGINLYATVLVLGFLGRTGNMVLPDQLAILMDPLVTAAAGIMYLAEFVADKVPGVDTGWDGIHTFIRIPAGALLAAGAVGAVNPAVAVAAGILGAGVAAGAHATKAGSRVLINASPEPFSNWIASIMEDVAVIGGVWAALRHPWVFLVLFVVFFFMVMWLLPRLWRAIKKVFGFVGKLFNLKAASDPTRVSPARGDGGVGNDSDQA